MCGIGGILRRDGQTIPEHWLDAIDARIAYRGPDGDGRFRDRSGDIEVALVHRRLSIIDHEGGTQPMVSEGSGIVNSGTAVSAVDDTGGTPVPPYGQGLVAVVFNGCIYNHRELREQLQAEGHVFTTDHSDTESLIHAYRQWGPNFTEHLEGMYAFALWDRENQSLVLARDWFGEKPLYVRIGVGEDAGVIAFASDARALKDLGHQGIEASRHQEEGELPGHSMPRSLDASIPCPPPAWTRRYLQLGYAHEGVTVYDGVRNLRPSIVNEVDVLIGPINTYKARKETTTQVEFELLIEQAVQRRLEADVPLGCFLSGGVDSSLIAYFANDRMPGLRTFTVRMPDERYDESPYAEMVADHLGTDHTTLEVAIDPAADLTHLIHTLGQPFGDSSILPTYWVAKAARQHVKVALSGDGGDELFIGYERYAAARTLYRHRRLLQWFPRRWLRGIHPKSLKHKMGRLGDMARQLKTLGMTSMEALFTQHQIYDLMIGLPGSPVHESPQRDPLQALRRFDLMHYLPDDLLCKVDTASMCVTDAQRGTGLLSGAHTSPLEVRCPFLDRDLVRAALAAPTSQLMAGTKRKGMLREIARKYLPAEIVDRPKMGFAIPVGEWFRNDFGNMQGLLMQHLQDRERINSLSLNCDAVQCLIDQHLTGETDHGQRLFALLTLMMWARNEQE